MPTINDNVPDVAMIDIQLYDHFVSFTLQPKDETHHIHVQYRANQVFLDQEGVWQIDSKDMQPFYVSRIVGHISGLLSSPNGRGKISPALRLALLRAISEML